MNHDRALAIRRAQAVRAGIAAAEDDYAFAGRGDLGRRIEGVAEVAFVLLRQEVHGEMDPLELAPRNRQIARLGRAHRQYDCIVLRAHLVGVDVETDAAVGDDLEPFGFHLLDAAIDDPLFKLEIGNTVGEQSADAIRSLVQRHRMAGAGELLRARQSRRPRSNHRDALARFAPRRHRRDPFLGPRVIDDVLLDQFDRDRIVVDVEHASFFTRRGTDTAGELGKIVSRVQTLDRLAPASAINEVVPIGDNVPERAALVAEGDSAIHAAGALRAQLLLGHLEIEFAPILQALPDRTPRRNLAFDL